MLADYMISYLGSLALHVNWTAASTPVTTAVSDTLEVLDIATEDGVEAKILHAVGRVKVLEAYLREISADYDYSTDGESFNRSQAFEMASKMLASSGLEAMAYLPSGEIEIGGLPVGNDPYLRGDL